MEKLQAVNAFRTGAARSEYSGITEVSRVEAGLRVHFIGIGGYGMSGLALVLLQTGYRVTGSDARWNERIGRLEAAGAVVHIGHDAARVQGADLVVYSTDVPAANPELAAARAAGTRVIHRSELLAEFINRQSGIAVTGTHGKTTVTSMIALLLQGGGLDPTALIGGEVEQLGGNARVGRGPHVVAEADESDRSFLRYFPSVAVITNIEPEHLDHYGGDFQQIVAAYRQFIGQIKPDGVLVACADDPRVMALAQERKGKPGAPRVILYSLSQPADWTAREIRPDPDGIRFRAVRSGQELGEVRLGVPGRQNVANALAAMAVADYLGVPFAAMVPVLAGFHGAKRRFQIIAERGGITVVDDYAHHPTEIRATLQAARERLAARAADGPGRVLAVFQPQRYTRTHWLMQEFAAAFGNADVLVLTEIYSPPGEQPIPGVSSEALARLIEARDGRPVRLISNQEEIVRFLAGEARPGDLVLTMGAGDIWQVARELGRQLAG